MADTSNIENGVTLRYTGTNGATIPFTAPSGATYEAGRNSPTIVVRPEDVDWMLMRSFERDDGDDQQSSPMDDKDRRIAELEREIAQMRGYTVAPMASTSTDPQEYPNNAVVRDPQSSDSTAAHEGAAQDAATLDANADDTADTTTGRRAGRPRKSDSE